MPFIAKTEKSGYTYVRYINFLEYMTIVRNIKTIYKETILYPFEGPYLPIIVENLGMSMKGCTNIYSMIPF